MLIACCLFCNLLLLSVETDSGCTEKAYQPRCYWRLLVGYDFLLHKAGRLLLCCFDVVVIAF